MTPSKALIRRAVQALRYKARDIAGHSQYPYLIQAENTQEWRDAIKLQEWLDSLPVDKVLRSIKMNKQVIEQALGALEELCKHETLGQHYSNKCCCNAIDALKEAVKNQEPVAWIEHHKAGDNLNWEEVNHLYAKATPLCYCASAPSIPEGWREFIEECAGCGSYEISNNALAAKAQKLLSAAPKYKGE